MKEKDVQARVIADFKEMVIQNGKSIKTAGSYAGALKNGGALSEQVRCAGLLPDGAEGLLFVEDEDALRAIARWWNEEGMSRCTNTSARAAMPWLLKFRGVSEQSAPAAAAAPRLGKPPCGITLRFLLSEFVKDLRDWEATGHRESKSETRTVLVLKLMDKPYADLPHKVFQEHTYEFFWMRSGLLDRLDRDFDGAVKLLKETYQPERLVRACHNVVRACLDECGGEILSDLRRRRVNYEDSVLFSLDGMYRQLRSGGGCADLDVLLRCFLELMYRVLLDCDPAALVNDPVLEPGAALHDGECSGENGLLWSWLDWGPVSDSALEQLLLVTLPDQARLAQYLFRNLLHAAHFPGGVMAAEALPGAAEAAGKALVYLELHWEQLQPLLARKGAAWWTEIPEEHLLGGKEHCLLAAQMQIHRAQLLVRMGPGDKDGLAWGYRLMLCQEALRRAEKSLEQRARAKQHVLEEMAGRHTMGELWVRLYLCRAELYRQLARQETVENCLGDAVTMYIAPARRALELAQLRLERAAGVSGLEELWQQTCRSCARDFFGADSPVVIRMRLRGEEDTVHYQQEFACWHSKSVPTPSAPVITRRLTKEELYSADQFDTIYCGAFDSRLSRQPGQQKNVELTFFQILCSGRVSLLQMNQIADNWSMLRLMHTPGFRQSCREGIITLSCYGSVNNPKTYLINSLKNPGFKFSSSGLYELPQDADAAAVENSLRGAMLRYLEHNDPAAFRMAPAALREEAEFLMEAYAMLFECFQPSDLLRFHQNPDTRMPPMKGTVQPVIQPLGQVMYQRLEALTKEALEGDPTKSLDTLRALKEFGQRLGFPDNRSHYDLAIEAAQKKEGTGAQERRLLDKFMKLVDQCYFLSNGRRSSRQVLLTETDPDLIQRADRELAEDPGADVLECVLRQRNQPASDSNLAWPDVCQLALEARRIDMENQHLSARERSLKLEQATGLKHGAVGNGTLATGLTPKLSTGEVVSIRPDESADAQALEFHTT